MAPFGVGDNWDSIYSWSCAQLITTNVAALALPEGAFDSRIIVQGAFSLPGGKKCTLGTKGDE